MRSLRFAFALVALSAAPALGDEKVACAEGIAMIEAALARTSPEAAGTTLNKALVETKLGKALRIAKREQGEGEFDECLDAVGDAKRALGQ